MAQQESTVRRDSFKYEELIAGNLSGWACVTVGQPLDFIKVHTQLAEKMPNIPDIYKRIGFHGFYKGASTIYLMAGSISAISFSCFETMSDFLMKKGLSNEGGRSIANLAVSGFVTGIVAALIFTPIEYSKIQSQISFSQKQGSIGRIVQIVRQEKLRGVRKLYTGLKVTMFKQSIGSAIYYGGYQIILTKLLAFDREKAPVWAQTSVGSLAGVLYQLWAFPLDMIKTNVQSGAKTASQMIATKYWRTKGFRQGFAINVSRSLLTDSTNFMVFENVRNLLIKARSVY